MKQYGRIMMLLGVLSMLPQLTYGIEAEAHLDANEAVGTYSAYEEMEVESVRDEAITQQVSEDLTSQLTTAYLLEQIQDPLFYKRCELILEGKEVVSDKDFAEVLCVLYGVGPLYHEAGWNPYKMRLMTEGTWPLSEGDVPSKQVWATTYGAYLESGSVASKEAMNGFEAIPLDYVEISAMQVTIDGSDFPLYRLGDSHYVSMTTLEQVGFNIHDTEGVLRIQEPYSLVSETVHAEYDVTQEKVKLMQGGIYMGGLQSYGLCTSQEAYIPVRALQAYFDLTVEPTRCVLTLKEAPVDDYIQLEGNDVFNTGTEVISLEGVQYYWDGESIREAAFTITKLQPGERYPLYAQYYGRVGIIPYSTVIHTVVRESDDYTVLASNPIMYGQQAEGLFNTYEINKIYQNTPVLEDLFPQTVIIGTMKYDTNGFKKGESVEVYRAHSGSYYYLWREGQTVRVPWGSVQIPSNPTVQKVQATQEEIEAYINEQNIESRTNYLVWTDLYRQRTYVFQKQQGRWGLIRNMISKTGNNITPTPAGGYELTAYVPYFGVNKGYRCKNAVQFWGDYLYHSVLFDVTGSYVLSGQVLGERGSLGCINLSVEDSEWFYNTMPLKTRVIIR